MSSGEIRHTAAQVSAADSHLSLSEITFRVQLLLQLLEVCCADSETTGKIARQWLVANADRTNLRYPVTPDGGDLTEEESTIVSISDELRSCGVWPFACPFPAISASGPYDRFLEALGLLVVELPLPQRIAALRTSMESFTGYEAEAAGYLLGWMAKCEVTIHRT